MTDQKISVIVTTYNEEDCIEKCLESVSWADEILVVDSFSTDRTVSLARKYTDQIFQREYINAADQKNGIIPQARNPWIFLLDADEYVLETMKSEIFQKVEEAKFDAFWIRRQNFLMGKKIRFSGWQGDKVIRLFMKDTCRYEEKRVHSEIRCTGRVGRMKNQIFHQPFKNVDHFIKKIDRYTSWSALDKLSSTKRITLFHLWFKPAFRFIQFFILRLGFLDGKRGFLIASFAAYSVYLRSAKLYEMLKGDKGS